MTANLNGAVSSYAYDGLGQRVSKTTGVGTANPVTTTYVYDQWGNVAAEYATQSTPSPCGTPTCYVTQDHLGSTRMLTDNVASGSVVRYDYQPFGQELLAGYGARTAAMGYLAMADATNPKFTGQQADQETGLDWFQVRQMSGAQGRFQSTDPGNAGADPGDPQTWNGYAYVGNNPLSVTDPSGESWWSTLIGVGLDIAGLFTGGTSTILGTILTTAGTVATGGSIGGQIIGNISGGVNGGPWNEQIPGLGGGGVNTGGVFGGLCRRDICDQFGC